MPLDTRPPPPVVIALTHGLPPYAQPLVSTDLVGTDALFGGAFYRLPSMRPWTVPVGNWLDPPVSSVMEGHLLLPDNDRQKLLFEVPAVTYLTGAVTSTFEVAWKLFAENLLPPWGAVLAVRQTEGRGQLRRVWHSPAGNLHVSVRLPEDSTLRSGAAALLVGYLLASSFRRLGFPLFLKWPNDLLDCDDGKVGGILLEERDGVLLAGIGVNLAHAPPSEFLRQEAAAPSGVLFGTRHTGKRVAPLALWGSLVRAIIVEYTRFVADRPLSEVLTRLAPYLAWRNSPVALSDGEKRIIGFYQGVGREGELLLRLDTGEICSFHGGSLSKCGGSLAELRLVGTGATTASRACVEDGSL